MKEKMKLREGEREGGERDRRNVNLKILCKDYPVTRYRSQQSISTHAKVLSTTRGDSTRCYVDFSSMYHSHQRSFDAIAW